MATVVSRLRRRFRDLVRAEIAATVARSISYFGFRVVLASVQP
jgi:hypothetical protein